MMPTSENVKEIFNQAEIEINDLSKEEIEKVTDAFEEMYLMEDDIDFLTFNI